VEHSGGDAGYRSHVMRFPDQKLAVVILSNLASFNPSLQSRQVADLYLADQLVSEAPKTDAPKTDSARPPVTINYKRERSIDGAADRPIKDRTGTRI
jgi:hypothetical protein